VSAHRSSAKLVSAGFTPRQVERPSSPRFLRIRGVEGRDIRGGCARNGRAADIRRELFSPLRRGFVRALTLGRKNPMGNRNQFDGLGTEADSCRQHQRPGQVTAGALGLGLGRHPALPRGSRRPEIDGLLTATDRTPSGSRPEDDPPFPPTWVAAGRRRDGMDIRGQRRS